MATATFGAGCFWHVEESFRRLKGVTSTAVGYMGGSLINPSYEDVCSDETGHAEVVNIEFDPSQITYDALLDLFWKIHNPTQLDRQGVDVGSQYRSAIFFHNPEQEKAAKESRARQQEKLGRRIVTQITPAKPFYRAEDYHQQYLARGGRGSCAIF